MLQRALCALLWVMHEWWGYKEGVGEVEDDSHLLHRQRDRVWSVQMPECTAMEIYLGASALQTRAV